VNEAVGQDPCANGNPNGPCAWPAQKYEGGITLGTTELDGQSAALFDPNSLSIDPDYSDAGSVSESDTLASGVDSGPAEVVTVGFNVNTVDNLFLHKTWKTQAGSRDVPGENPNPSNYDDVYVYIQTGSGTLEGPSETDPDINCRDPDSNGDFNPNHCDLIVKVTEISFENFDFQATISGIPLIGSTQVDDSQIGELSSSPDDGYWVTEPQQDTCGFTDIFTLSGGLNINGFCLSLLDPTFTDTLGGLADEATINELVLYNLMVRGHTYQAVPPNPDDPDQNKILQLGEEGNSNDNFYAEIRWGKGHDRATFPPSSNNVNDPSNPPGQRFGGPSPVDSNFETDTSRVSGLSNNFDCEGNPTGVGYTTCNQPSQNIGPLQPGPYDDIYR
jgi:hypothetical protein